MRYMKKPVIIEAFKWTGGPDQVEDPVWMCDAIREGKVFFEDDTIKIRTLEGLMTAQPGDFIIKGVKGEIYPCKPDIFEMSYIQVSEGHDHV